MIESNRLDWRPTRRGRGLFHGKSPKPLCEIVSDAKWPKMFRVLCRDELSDLCNASRASDAALSIALVLLNNPGETAPEPRPCAESIRGAA